MTLQHNRSIFFFLLLLSLFLATNTLFAGSGFDFSQNIILATPGGHDADDSQSILYRLVKFIGKFHVLLIHFPIAFLAGACVSQWWFVVKGKGEQAATVMLWFGSLGAVVAASLGWAYAYDSAYFGESADILFWHRWLGTITAVLSSLLLLFKGKLNKTKLAIALTLCAILVGIAGHFGGTLVYGSDFFTDF